MCIKMKSKLLVIIYLCFIYVQHCESIKTINSCKCELQHGQVIDLSKLAKKDGSSRFSDVVDSSGKDKFSYNPCNSFSVGTCQDVAVCQERDTLYYNAGNQAGATCAEDSSGRSITYTADSFESNTVRTTVVVLVCDHTKEGDLLVHGETTESTYLMILTSKYACPFKPSGLSAGSILIIIFVGLIFVYFIGGIIFQTVKRGATGKERIPNLPLWIQLPSLVKDGTMFTISKITRKEYNKI